MLTQIMESNLNRNGINNYSTRYAKKVVANYFKDKKIIDGEAIKSLVDIQQINLFVIKNLFEAWQLETAKLKSKYFDYGSEGVQNALLEFMNVLSRNISIKKDDFEPLLIKAVEESVLLIFSPYDFYTHLAEHANGEMTIENLKRTLKYVRVNKNLLENLINKMEHEKLEKVDEATYSKLLNGVFQNIQASPDDIGIYFDNFSKIEPLLEQDIYGVLIDEKEDGPVITKVTPSEKEIETINEKHAKHEPTIVEIHQSKKIESIKSGLSINQTFMFKNVLFDGDEIIFNQTIEYLDNCENKKSAMDYIYKEFPHWNIESEEFEEFVELIEKRLG
jgi:hypothetical protein